MSVSKPSRQSAYRSAQRFGKPIGIGSITVDLAGFHDQIEAYKEKLRAATRPAAQAGAQVIYKMARMSVPVSSKEHFFYGKYYQKTGTFYGVGGGNDVGPIRKFQPGNLRNAIYQAFSQDKSTDDKATYHVSVRLKDAPYAYMVEFGTSRAPAHPFLTKALHDHANDALEAMRKTFVEHMQS